MTGAPPDTCHTPGIAGVCWCVLDDEVEARRRANVVEVPALRSIPALEPFLGCVVAVELPLAPKRRIGHDDDRDVYDVVELGA